MRLGGRPLAVRTRLTLWYTTVLFGILLVVSALSYAMLRFSLMQDLDASLEIVAQVIRDTGYTAAGSGPGSEAAVREMVQNAVTYTPAGGTVEIALTARDGWAAVAVQDTGSGVEPADVERIFEPFVRLDAARDRATGGAGLGLAIARSIAVAHAGTLTLESGPGAGCRFTLRLPLA